MQPHPLCHEKGKLIGQKQDDRDKSKSLQEQECLIQQLFQKDELVSPFLEHIHQAKPRYYRDQQLVIRKLFEEWDVGTVNSGASLLLRKRTVFCRGVKIQYYLSGSVENSTKEERKI